MSAEAPNDSTGANELHVHCAQEHSSSYVKPISSKQTTVARAAIETDYTVRKLHSVGQMVHNLHKINRVLEKINYNGDKVT